MRGAGGLAVVVACAAACGDGGGANASSATVRDSAGIEIVESSAPAHAGDGGPRLAGEPVVAIGGGEDADSTRQLFGVQAARRLRDGRVVVADGGSSQIRFYDADGTLRRAAGGKGGGPGEFGALSWLEVGAGDSVIAYDTRERRFTIVDDTGAFVRVFAPAQAEDAPLLPRPVALLGDGTVLATTSVMFRRSPPTVNGPVRDTVAFVRVARDGEVRATESRVPAAERIVFVSTSAVEVLTPPFAHVLAATGGGAHAYAASGASYQIARYDSAGRVVRLLRIPGVERRVTAADVDAHVERVTADAPDPAARQRLATRLRGVAIPERMPAVSRLLVDDAERLWAMDFLAPRDTAATWRVFDADGRWLASIAVPRAFTIHAVRDGHAVGVWRDEDDVEQVRVYVLDDGF